MILILRENKRKKSLVVSFQNRLKNEIGRNDRLNIVQIDECIVEFWRRICPRWKMISTLLKGEENKNHLIALKKGRIIQNTSSSSEKEERTKEGIKNTLCEYGCVISRERHTHTQRARTWYIYVVYKPLFSRTFVFFRREILCRVLMKRRSLLFLF